MEPVLGVLPYVVLSLLVPAGFCLVTRPDRILDAMTSWRERLSERIRRGRSTATRAPRPIEEVVADLRRLGRQAHGRQVSHVKAESVSRAYDRVLAEACAALEVEHLLGVLSGADLDRERRRVEQVLHRWGLNLSDLDEAA